MVQNLAPRHKGCGLRRFVGNGHPAAALSHRFGLEAEGRAGRYLQLKCALRVGHGDVPESVGRIRATWAGPASSRAKTSRAPKAERKRSIRNRIMSPLK